VENRADRSGQQLQHQERAGRDEAVAGIVRIQAVTMLRATPQ
jgi:hypothetical protein